MQQLWQPRKEIDLKTKGKYLKYLKKLEELFEINSDLITCEETDKLVLLIQEYEDKFKIEKNA